MAIRAIGWANDTRMDASGNLKMEVQVTIENGNLGSAQYTTARDTSTETIATELHTLVRTYAETQMGQTFEVGDSVRVFIQLAI